MYRFPKCKCRSLLEVVTVPRGTISADDRPVFLLFEVPFFPKAFAGRSSCCQHELFHVEQFREVRLSSPMNGQLHLNAAFGTYRPISFESLSADNSQLTLQHVSKL